MMMFLVYVLFMLSVAFASAGIVLSIRLRNRYRSDCFSTLMYFQVFIYTFGFYGIWGQIVIRTFLSNFVSAEAIARFSDLSLLLGLPFVVFAWLMLLKFSLELSGRKSANWLVVWFLLINLLIIIGIGFTISGNTSMIPMSLERSFYLILSLVYTSVSSAIILIPSKNSPVIHKTEKKISALSIMSFMIIQALLLYFYKGEQWLGMSFIFIFFAGNSFFPVYLSYGAAVSAALNSTEHELLSKVLSIEDFCKKYDISPRESDIIREICNGLSNKEISEKLFISLQTVKDHTHRIYTKTNVRSRMQLMKIVKIES